MPLDGPPERLAPGRIRMLISGALEISIQDDPRIGKEDLYPLLSEISRIIGRKVTLPTKRPKHGWQMYVSRMTSYIYDNQSKFEPIVPEPENQNPEEPQL